MPAIAKTDNYRINKIGSDVAANVLIGGDMPKNGKFIPNINASFECDTGAEQYFLNINRLDAIVTTETEVFDGSDVRISIGDTTDIFKTVDNETKWDIEYQTDPRPSPFVGDYVETFTLSHSPELSFYYQTPLTQAEINGGHVRSEKAQGSYAVYCDKAGNTPNGSFFTGKLCHIYRPWIADSLGAGVWGELNISGNILTITIPGSFLDVATPPITLDPNLGYTTIGASSAGYNNAYYLASHDTSDGSGGTVTDIYIHIGANTGTTHCKVAAYDSGTNRPDTQLAVESEITVTTASTWYSVAYSTSFSASTKYWVAWIGDNVNLKASYDTADANRQNYATSVVYDLPATWPDPGSNNTTRWSLYAVYGAAGGRIMGSLAGLGGLAGHGGLAGKGGGLAG